MGKFKTGLSKKNGRKREDKTIIDKIVGGSQWDNANLKRSLRFYISQKCPGVAFDDNERLDRAKVIVVVTSKSFFDCGKGIFTQHFINISSWTCFNAVTGETIPSTTRYN